MSNFIQFTPEQHNFIVLNYGILPAGKIAEELGVSVTKVVRYMNTHSKGDENIFKVELPTLDHTWLI